MLFPLLQNTQLLEEVQRLQVSITSSMSQISRLEEQLEQKRQLIARLETKLDAQRDYDDLKRELRLVLKTTLTLFLVKQLKSGHKSGIKWMVFEILHFFTVY